MAGEYSKSSAAVPGRPSGEEIQDRLSLAVSLPNQLRDSRFDQLFHRRRAFVTVLVAVPVDERNVFGVDLDVARARLDQPPCEQTSLAEPSRVVRVERPLRFERQVECF